MLIRTATIEDLDAVTAVEAECFPPAEAATRSDFEQRLAHYSNHFWLMFDEDKLIAFVDGMVTDMADLTDEMYEHAALHKEDGTWQMIFGVNTGIPQTWLCRSPHPTCHLRCQSPGPQRTCAHLQR